MKFYSIDKKNDKPTLEPIKKQVVLISTTRMSITYLMLNKIVSCQDINLPLFRLTVTMLIQTKNSIFLAYFGENSRFQRDSEVIIYGHIFFKFFRTWYSISMTSLGKTVW